LTESSYRQTFYRALLVILTAWFLAAYLDKTAATALYFDSAWHGSVAKNVAIGVGYASSFDGLHHFEPDVTTGPAPILLAALAIKIFGNAYSLPLYVAALLNLTLAIAVMAGVWRLRGRSTALASAACFALLLTFYEERWWHIFTGDLPALLLGLLGLQALALALHDGQTRHFALTGLALALALLSKLLAAIVLMAALGMVLIYIWRNRSQPGSTLPARGIVVLVIALGLPLLAWQLYSADSPTGEDRSGVWERNSVGISQLLKAEKPLQHMGTALQASHRALNQKLGRYGLPVGSYLLLLAASVLICVHALRHQSGPWQTWLAGFALACCGFWLWHLLFNLSQLTKYTLYPTLMTLWLMCMAAAGTRWRWYTALVLVAWIVLSPSRTADHALRFASFSYPDDIYRAELLAMAAEIEQYQQELGRPPLAACGWNNAPWPLEYVLPGAANFLDCHQHLLRAMRMGPDGEYQWIEGQNLGFSLVQERILWKLDKLDREKNTLILELCDRQAIYENEGFRLLRCRDAALREGIPLEKDSPFLEINRPGTRQR